MHFNRATNQLRFNAAVNTAANSVELFGRTVNTGAGAFVSLIPIIKTLQIVGSGLIESQRRHVAYNATIASAVATLDFERLNQSIEFARRTSTSTQSLTQSQARLEQAMLPGQAAAKNLIQDIVASLQQTAAIGIESANIVAEGAVERLKNAKIDTRSNLGVGLGIAQNMLGILADRVAGDNQPKNGMAILDEMYDLKRKQMALQNERRGPVNVPKRKNP